MILAAESSQKQYLIQKKGEGDGVETRSFQTHESSLEIKALQFYARLDTVIPPESGKK